MKRGKGFGESSSRIPSKANFTQHPLSLIEGENIPEVLDRIGQSATARYNELLLEIRSIITSSDPMLVLAILASYGLTVGIDDQGNYKRLASDPQFGQQHVEQAQALSLTIAPDEISPGIADPETIQLLFDLLPELGNAYSLHRLAGFDSLRSEEEKSVSLLQEYLRLHTQSIRNWGYFGDVIQIVSDLVYPLDKHIEASLGFSGSTLINLFEKIVEAREDDITSWVAGVKLILGQKNIKNIVEKWTECAGDREVQLRSVMKIIKERKLSKHQVKAMILHHKSLELVDIYSMNTQELASSFALDHRRVKAIFEKLCIAPGDLSSLATEQELSQILLANPVWTKPLIKVDSDTYFCVIPQLFFSFIFPILGELFSADSKLKLAYAARRSDYLESEVAKLLQDSLPGSSVVRGYKWNEDSVEYESDLIISVGTTLLLVEAKSGSISWSALRGAPDRAKKHIRQLLHDPSRQSERLALYLRRMIDANDEHRRIVDCFPMDISRASEILRLSVTLEDFATIQTNLRMVKRTGWIPHRHTLAPCISLSDLKVITSILETSGRILYYLRMRSRLEETFNYTGDELDLLGLFLTSDLNTCIASSEDAHLTVSGMSRDIDDYYLGIHSGASPLKPSLRQTQWFHDIEKRIEDMKHGQWSDAIDILLGCSHAEQERILKKFRWVKRNVRVNRNDPAHICSVMLGPYGLRENGLILYAFHSSEAQSRHTRISELSGNFFENSNCKKCLVVGVRTDKDDYPYSTLAFMSRPANID